MKLFVTGVLLGCITMAAAADPQKIPDISLPPDFSARFELLKNGLPVAETEYRLTRQQQELSFQASTQLTGFAALFSNEKITEKTLLEITPAKELRLKQYQFQQTGNKEKNISSYVNWGNKTIVTRINQQPETKISIFEPFWDKHSVLLALMSAANTHQQNLSFNILDAGTIKKYEFHFTGTKEIELDDDDWKQTRIWKKTNGRKETLFYLDPADSNMPLKIEQYKHQKLRATLWLKELKWYE